MQNFTLTSCLGILFDHFVLTYLNVEIIKLLSIQLAKCHRRKKSVSGLFFAQRWCKIYETLNYYF